MAKGIGATLIGLFRMVGTIFGWAGGENRGKKIDLKVTEHGEQERLRTLENSAKELDQAAELLEERKQLRLAEIKFHKFNLIASGSAEDRLKVEALDNIIRDLEDVYIEQGGKLKLKERRRIRKRQKRRKKSENV